MRVAKDRYWFGLLVEGHWLGCCLLLTKSNATTATQFCTPCSCFVATRHISSHTLSPHPTPTRTPTPTSHGNSSNSTPPPQTNDILDLSTVLSKPTLQTYLERPTDRPLLTPPCLWHVPHPIVDERVKPWKTSRQPVQSLRSVVFELLTGS